MTQGGVPALDLDDIQGDVLVGLQKNVECFLFFKIAEASAFKALLRHRIAARLTSAQMALKREHTLHHHRQLGRRAKDPWAGINLGFTRHGMTLLLGSNRAPLDPAFERGADHAETIDALNDPPPSTWLPQFVADRIDGVFLITGPDANLVQHETTRLLMLLGRSIKPVYSEVGHVRPGKLRGYEHFGFRDGISQPGIRGLTKRASPYWAPDQGLPGQDLLWPGEFVFGYPGQDARDVGKPGPVTPLPAGWARNGSFMVFRRLEQRVPEFHQFLAANARSLGIGADLLGARLFGRWPSGAPLEEAPLRDDTALAMNKQRNNDFDYADDPFQRRCPYAAHIRKSYPRDDAPGGEAAMQTHRILRAGITFGPEVQPGETQTAHSRGLMFVCYQLSIGRQFEHIQAQFANAPGFVSGKRRPAGGGPVTPGYDPIIGQTPGSRARFMDEPAPNYPAGNRRTSLQMPEQFVTLTAAGYFFMPSLSAVRTAFG